MNTLSLWLIFHKRAPYLVALLRKMTCNFKASMELRHPVWRYFTFLIFIEMICIQFLTFWKDFTLFFAHEWAYIGFTCCVCTRMCACVCEREGVCVCACCKWQPGHTHTRRTRLHVHQFNLLPAITLLTATHVTSTSKQTCHKQDSNIKFFFPPLTFRGIKWYMPVKCNNETDYRSLRYAYFLIVIHNTGD